MLSTKAKMTSMEFDHNIQKLPKPAKRCLSPLNSSPMDLHPSSGNIYIYYIIYNILLSKGDII